MLSMFLDDIYYFEIKGRIVNVHGPEGIFTYYGQIGELGDKLRDKGFFRCHKSYLINLKYVDVYNRQDIKWECDVHMPKECCINEFELCVLFGNILDNALDACGRM